ncbi:MAG: 6-hydroxymethylpterin diphosphokinase MptE-like protein [Thermodesulfobacteriota bacterium]
MKAPTFIPELLRQNFAALAAAAPEVACWLQGQADFGACDGASLAALAAAGNPLLAPDLRPDGITLVVGGGALDEVAELLARMPAGHQVFVLQPRPELLALGLGRHDLADHLAEGSLVLLAPAEAAMEEALARHPQLALAEALRVVQCCGPAPGAPEEAARARLFRVLGQALLARDWALAWEGPSGANLIRNLCHLAFMGRAAELPGALRGRPALILEAGPSLESTLEALQGRLGGAAVFCSDAALPRVLAAGVLPTAVAVTSPAAGPLTGWRHPDLARVPLIAEETAHADTVKHHPGPRLVCLGPRLGLPGFLEPFAAALTPQHHTLGRLAEFAALMGCEPLILAGADLTDPAGGVLLPGMDGDPVATQLGLAAAANALGRVLARVNLRAFNLSRRGLGLPGTRVADPAEVVALLGGPGQPLRLAGLDRERWLTPTELALVARGLRLANTGATRLWQRAAAPLMDFPCDPEKANPRLVNSADQLFVALAEQAAAEPLLSAFLGGCLVRAFRRRHQMLCNGGSAGVRLDQACREIERCLRDMESRAGELSVALSQMAEEFEELARARAAGDGAFLADYARQTGRAGPPPEA